MNEELKDKIQDVLCRGCGVNRKFRRGLCPVCRLKESGQPVTPESYRLVVKEKS